MNVLQVNKYYHPHLGGVENHVRSLTTALKERVEVGVLCANDVARTIVDRVDGVEVTRLANLYGGMSAPIAPGFLSKLPKAGIDLHHVHYPSGLPEVALARKPKRGAIVVTYHSDIVRQKTLKKLFEPYARTLLTKADRVIVGSPDLIANSPMLAPVKEKCVVVPFGVEPADFEVTAEVAAKVDEVRSTYGERILFFLGRLIYYKGVDRLIEAMIEIDATLLVGGSGPLEAELKAQAERLGVAGKVVFLAELSHTDRVACYRTCDVFVLPSIAPSEAYGLTQVEAHICGKPVVSTDLPTGVPFVNQNSATGFVVPPGDSKALAIALNRLLDDAELRMEMGERARERALAVFTVERMVESTLDLYKEILEGTPAAVSTPELVVEGGAR